jgi:hypothetical protein
MSTHLTLLQLSAVSVEPRLVRAGWVLRVMCEWCIAGTPLGGRSTADGCSHQAAPRTGRLRQRMRRPGHGASDLPEFRSAASGLCRHNRRSSEGTCRTTGGSCTRRTCRCCCLQSDGPGHCTRCQLPPGILLDLPRASSSGCSSAQESLLPQGCMPPAWLQVLAQSAWGL